MPTCLPASSPAKYSQSASLCHHYRYLILLSSRLFLTACPCILFRTFILLPPPLSFSFSFLSFLPSYLLFLQFFFSSSIQSFSSSSSSCCCYYYSVSFLFPFLSLLLIFLSFLFPLILVPSYQYRLHLHFSPFVFSLISIFLPCSLFPLLVSCAIPPLLPSFSSGVGILGT